jgi:hypothetical protein
VTALFEFAAQLQESYHPQSMDGGSSGFDHLASSGCLEF